MFDYYNNLGQPVVQLDDLDVARCKEIVKQKVAYCETHKQQHKYAQVVKLHEPNYCGALGEQAVAHYFDFDYKYRDYNVNLYDVLGYEVRTTYRFNGRLLTHADDKNARYIFVTVDKITLCATIRGYSPLSRCNERQSNWDDTLPDPCFAMQQNQLWPIDTLPATPELIAHQAKLAA